DLRSFQQCLASTVAPTVSAVAEGHRSLAVSTFFGHYFNLKFGYEVDASRLLREGESLIQGQQILPTVGVSTDFGLNTGLTGQILIDIADAKTTIDLLFEPQANTYRAVKNFDTSSVVGPMTISFILSKHLALIGDVTFARRESKLVGYGIDVTPSAVHTASGRSILAGSVASPGTSFHFPVHLYTLSNPTLTSGPFTVLLKAVDSSGTAIHSASIDGLSAAEGLNFEYVLHRNDLPPGQLTFEFSVEDHGRRGAHTHTSVTYAIETTLAAADIEASSTSLSIGDRLAVSFEPVIVLESAGTLPLGTEGDHEFFLDLTSAAGNVVHSVSGTPSGDRVSFSYVIPANPAVFASSLSLVFRYHPASGADTTLVHIDSTGAEAEQLSVAVLTELVLTDAETIPSSSYSYGDDVAWSFTLSDARSGSSIAASNSGRSGIFVSLRHGSGDDSFLSARIYAVASTGTTLAGKFTVTANALPGAATVLVEVLDIDGKAVSITGTSSRTVTIVGSIQASISTHSSSLVSAEKAAFIADFSLTHDNKPLPQSELHAIVYQGSELIPSLAHLPVAATPTGYSVSWTLPLDSAVSGQYEVRIVRTQEYRHFIQLLNDYSAASQRVHPITAISLYHSSPLQSYVGVPTEYFAIAIFGFISFKVLTTYALKPKSSKKK
ncbi:MAG: hypothetical protein Q8P67_05465, partial [archaeon]|nr:hypothetical protein [archaeon]